MRERQSPLNLPMVAQSLDFTCGPACFESMYRLLRGVSLGEMNIARDMGTLDLGFTLPTKVVEFARAHGFQCEMSENAEFEELRSEVEKSRVVFVTWWDEDAGHYSLVRSIGKTDLTLMDPWTARESRDNHLRIEEFHAHWKARGAKMIWVTDDA